jgi:hypothetical protein
MRNTIGIMINRNKKKGGGLKSERFCEKEKRLAVKAENSSASRQFRLQNTNH